MANTSYLTPLGGYSDAGAIMLRNMAAKAGIRGFAPHEAIVARDSADTLETTVNGFFNRCHSFGGENEHVPTDGSISFTLMGVEDALDGLGE